MAGMPKMQEQITAFAEKRDGQRTTDWASASRSEIQRRRLAAGNLTVWPIHWRIWLAVGSREDFRLACAG